MVKMKAVDAAVYVLEKEGCLQAFGVPGAAINPFYAALKRHGGVKHVLARHVEGASHMVCRRSRQRNFCMCIRRVTGLTAVKPDHLAGPFLLHLASAPPIHNARW